MTLVAIGVAKLSMRAVCSQLLPTPHTRPVATRPASDIMPPTLPLMGTPTPTPTPTSTALPNCRVLHSRCVA